MSATLIPLKTPLSSEAANNRFLRALWASLRAEFGKLAWQESPTRYGPRKVIYFGYADLGLSGLIRIGVTYKRRSIIDCVVFWNVFDKTNLPTDRFERCVRLAESATETEITISAKILVPYGLDFQRVERRGAISIFHHNNVNYLCLRFLAFDEADAAHQFALYTKPILDILSSFTNLFLNLDEYTDLLPPPLDVHRSTFSLNLDWIDGFPIINGMLVIPEQCFALIDAIVCDDLNVQKQQLIDACHHFHAARVLEEQSRNFSSTHSVAAELALVLYVSCLEVLSLINAPPPRTCSTCNQVQYSISARVTEFMEKHHGSVVAQFVRELYTFRSKYLHVGQLLSSRSYTGQAIPQLDSSSTNGTRSTMPMVPLLNLREYTSFCIRAVTHELTEFG